jgi:hypothetical protein
LYDRMPRRPTYASDELTASVLLPDWGRFSRFAIAFKNTTEGCTSETIKGRTGVTPCDP